MLVVGLGNPGIEYEETRHNVGFKVVEVLADILKISTWEKSCRSLWSEGNVDGKKVFLAKPQTFVNLSARSVSALLKDLNLDISSLLVVHDDMDYL